MKKILLLSCAIGYISLSAKSQCTPVFTVCPGDTITQVSNPTCDGAIINYANPTFTGCPLGQLVQTAGLPSGSTFPIGTTTNSFSVYLFHEDFSDNSAGWTTDGEWQIGAATSSSCAAYNFDDPALDHTFTGDNGIAGIVIGGCASTATHPYQYITSPIINTAGETSLILEFYRWLNSDYSPYMANSVEVFDGSTWQIVWQSGTSPGIQGSSWTLQSYDISAYANANMQIRFGQIVSNIGSYSVSSWNIDDVSIFSAASPICSFDVTVSPVLDSIDVVNSCSPITWLDGNTYSADNNTATHVIPNIYGCDSIIFHLDLNVQVSNDLTVNTPSPASHCDNGASTVTISNTQLGVNYYLIDDADNSIVDGPILGNGGDITFNTNTLNTTTTFSVSAEQNFNTSMSFDGVDDQIVAITGGASVSGTFTVEAWAKPNHATNIISIMGSRAPSDFSFDMKFLGGNLIHADIGNGSSWLTTNADATFAYNVGQWYHIAYVVTPNSYTIYVDGVQVGSGSYFVNTPLLFNSTHFLTIGDFQSLGGEAFDGNIDEIRVWSTARTQTEIQDNMSNELTGNESGLVLYYDFNEDFGTTTAADLTSNAYDGTLSWMDVNTVRDFDVPFGANTCDLSMTQTQTVTVDVTPIANATNNGDGTLSANGAGTYQWIDCGTNTPIAGANSATFIPTANGDYAVVVTNGSCDDTSACVTYNSVGLAENGNSVFTAYPNPTTGLITINSSNAIIAKIVVRDAAGRVIFENSNSSTSSSIDLSEMENGIYFITVFHPNQSSTTMKVTKQ